MPEQSTNLVVKVPFSGFYESDHYKLLDESFYSIYQDESGDTHPYALETDAGEVGTRYMTAYFDINWRKVHELYAKGYTENFEHQLNSDLKERGIKISLKCIEMKSPREYSYATDRIFAEISPSDAKKLLEIVDRDALAKLIKDNFTSCRRFISFYSNDLEDWLEKPVGEWDHNQLGILLEATVGTYGEARDYEAYELMESDRSNAVIKGWIHEAMGSKARELSAKIAEMLHDAQA